MRRRATGRIARASGVLAAAVLAAAGTAAAAGTPGGGGIRVYTWTDASGVTHFSDTPRPRGGEKTLVLPVPPPPDQTALAAQRAWLRQLDRETRADLARRERQRRAEEAAAARPAPQYQAPPVQYVPVFLPYRGYHRHGRRGRRDADDRGPARRPAPRGPRTDLPSSFPDPLQSSFVGGLPSSFPDPLASSFPPAPPH